MALRRQDDRLPRMELDNSESTRVADVAGGKSYQRAMARRFSGATDPTERDRMLAILDFPLILRSA
jgi:hypothetical protein